MKCEYNVWYQYPEHKPEELLDVEVDDNIEDHPYATKWTEEVIAMTQYGNSKQYFTAKRIYIRQPGDMERTWCFMGRGNAKVPNDNVVGWMCPRFEPAKLVYQEPEFNVHGVDDIDVPECPWLNPTIGEELQNE